MHPNPDFRPKPPELAEFFVREIGFAAIFASTPDGPRVAHTPILLDDSAAHIRFHIASGNALTRHLDGATALAVVQGPDAYVSPSDYRSADQVPTWNYIAVEMEGVVQRLNDDQTHQFLADLATVQESRAGIQPPWNRNAMPAAHYDRLFGAIAGFELRIQAWRPTFKCGQNKSAEDVASVAAALSARGHGALAQLMRHLASDKPQS
jgi:transcriptional regulator